MMTLIINYSRCESCCERIFSIFMPVEMHRFKVIQYNLMDPSRYITDITVLDSLFLFFFAFVLEALCVRVRACVCVCVLFFFFFYLNNIDTISQMFKSSVNSYRYTLRFSVYKL